MLNPDNRTLYLDALKAPAGYELDYAAAASYSLNLTTLIMLPLALSKYRYEFDQKEKIDKIQLLEALENNYDKMDVFCQKGQIAVPKNVNILYSFLEDTVVETQIEAGIKSFHPKIWILRFTDENENYKYRLIVSSRNITFDKSWDTILVLEGEKSGRTDENRKLQNFLNYLADSAAEKIDQNRIDKLKELAAELSEVHFETPAGFDDFIDFRAPGALGADSWPFKMDYNRALIISPFLSSVILNRFQGSSNILISRKTEIDKVYSQIKNKFSQIFLIDDLLEQDLNSDDDSLDLELSLRSGLHAKIYLLEDQENNQLYLYTGSANATKAAFNGNLEFMVGLRKTNPQITLKDLIEAPAESEIKFSSILSPYIPDTNSEDPEENSESELRKFKREFLNLNFYLEVEEKKLKGENLFDLKLKCREREAEILSKDDLEISCWPVTLKKDKNSRSLSELLKNQIIFSALTIDSLTSFMAFEIKISSQESISFVLNLEFAAEPQKRKERILTAIISDQNKFIKFLYLLLQDKDQFFLTDQSSLFKSKAGSSSQNNYLGLPLMEDLLQSLTDNVGVIDRIERIVREIEASDQKRIPEEFYDIWEAVVEVRREKIEGY
jgi:hypothetical protein